MNLQFLSIGMHMGREVGYFLDTQRNVVVRYIVQDFTGTQAAFMAPPVIMPAQPTDTFTSPEQFTVPQHEHVVSEPLPDKPRSIMPPGLAAMMQEGNQMGPNGY